MPSRHSTRSSKPRPHSGYMWTFYEASQVDQWQNESVGSQGSSKQEPLLAPGLLGWLLGSPPTASAHHPSPQPPIPGLCVEVLKNIFEVNIIKVSICKHTILLSAINNISVSKEM